ncbi:hypothetical protein DPMN_008966 [Dreissena polymorpha]|uniref:PWWP domain-containing protein n=1 Tax=Dreissena polymorpha TaxID=45954 RepID=A0A9D4MZF1_DREPO|nr:hypothetical protein DPMN_008966 [Dreissena polymorpha]
MAIQLFSIAETANRNRGRNSQWNQENGKECFPRVTFAESNLSGIPTCNTMDYQQGDLVWAKVEGHPWWPALVWPGPKGSIFKETKKSKQIHVQFFSEPPTTAWIKEKSVDKFEGKDSPLCQPGKKYHSAKKTFIMALDSAQRPCV